MFCQLRLAISTLGTWLIRRDLVSGIKAIERALSNGSYRASNATDYISSTISMCNLDAPNIDGSIEDLCPDAIVGALVDEYERAPANTDDLQSLLSLPLLKGVTTTIVDIEPQPGQVGGVAGDVPRKPLSEWIIESLDKDSKLLVDVEFWLSKLGGLAPKVLGPRPYAGFLLAHGESLLSDIRGFAKEFGISFSEDAEVRCLYNYLTLNLHHIALYNTITMPTARRRALYAVSAIHPLVDDQMDRGQYASSDISITRSLLAREEPVDTILLTSNTTKVAELIATIYAYRPPERHPELRRMFLGLLNAQVASITLQASTTTSDEQILQLSFEKGGYAFALFGCVLLDNVSSQAISHFFTVGAVFQLMDDFHDIRDDLRDGWETVFTRELARSGTIEVVVHKLAAIQLWYERNTNLVRDSANPFILRLIMSFGVRYDLFRFSCTNWAIMSESVKEIVRNGYGAATDSAVELFANSVELESVAFYWAFVERVKARFS